MEKPKSSLYDIGVYVFYVLVIGGLFAALWQATDFFSAVAAIQFLAPIIIFLSIGPSMFFGEMIVAAAKLCRKLVQPKDPPHDSVPGHPVHAPI